MENLTEARCAVCGDLKSEHDEEYEQDSHKFLLAAAHVKQEKAKEMER